MNKLYSSVDIVVLPSWREGLSKTLIEASSMERPIITTNVPGCKDIIELFNKLSYFENNQEKLWNKFSNKNLPKISGAKDVILELKSNLGNF